MTKTKTKKKNRISRLVGCMIALLAAFLTALPSQVMAEPVWDAGARNEVRIGLHYRQGAQGSVQETIAISGAEISLYKIASIDWDDAGQDYLIEMTGGFESSGLRIRRDDSADVFLQKAEALRTFLEGKSIDPIQKGETDGDGWLTLQDLDNGYYLAVQTGAEGKAKDYQTLDPFILNLPETRLNESGLVIGWNHRRELEAKTRPQPTPTPPTPTPPAPTPPAPTPPTPTPPSPRPPKPPAPSVPKFLKSVKTGDPTTVIPLVMILAAGGGLVLLAFLKKRKKDETDQS